MNSLLREIYNTKPYFVCKQTGEELLLIPLKDNVADFNQYLVLNELGAFIWTALSAELTFDALQDQILNEFEVEEGILRTDLEKFIPEIHRFTRPK
jgi:hypothetical protein